MSTSLIQSPALAPEHLSRLLINENNQQMRAAYGELVGQVEYAPPPGEESRLDPFKECQCEPFFLSPIAMN